MYGLIYILFIRWVLDRRVLGGFVHSEVGNPIGGENKLPHEQQSGNGDATHHPGFHAVIVGNPGTHTADFSVSRVPVEPSAAAFDALRTLPISMPASRAIFLGTGFSGGEFFFDPCGGVIDERRGSVGKLTLGGTDKFMNRCF